jgi:hypothetical protein
MKLPCHYIPYVWLAILLGAIAIGVGRGMEQ